MTNVKNTSATNKLILTNAFVDGLLDHFPHERIVQAVNESIFQYAYNAEDWDNESKRNIFLLKVIAETSANRKDDLFHFFNPDEISKRINDLIFQFAYYTETWDEESKDAIFVLQIIAKTAEKI